MKGLVFSEFLEFVEERFSPKMSDDIIEGCDLPSGGIYTSVGTYHHKELVDLVSALSDKSGTPVPGLVRAFGQHLFGRLTGIFPHFVQSASSTFELLRSVEDYIHVEVRKLYPDAELPTFEFESPHPSQLIVIYRSRRPLADLAHGMMAGAIEYFGENICIERSSTSGVDDSAVKFTLTAQG